MLYIVYGLSGPMKKLFTDILRESISFGTVTVSDSQVEVWNAFNYKGTTRSRRYYDDKDTMKYVSEYYVTNKKEVIDDVISAYKNLVNDPMFDKEFIYQTEEKDKQDFTWYAINIEHIDAVINSGCDHFVLCNNLEIILKLTAKYKNKCKIIKFFIKNIRECFMYLRQKYNALINAKAGFDIEIEARIEKATNLIATEQNASISEGFGELKRQGLLESIEILDVPENEIECNLRKKLFLILNAYSTRFDWKRLLTTRRIVVMDNYSANIFISRTVDSTKKLLSPFIKDYNVICSLSSFRRMQDKCQVFPLKRYDYARTRLTHSLEVAATAEYLGESAVYFIRNERNTQYDIICRAIPTLLRNAALLHDMGNPPFGHFSEDAIRLWFKNNLKYICITDSGVVFDDSGLHPSQYTLTADMQCDMLYYEGNAQLLRLLTNLADLRGGVDSTSWVSPNLTISSIATTIKYPTSSVQLHSEKLRKNSSNDICRKKNGYFSSEEEFFKHINQELGLKERRHPLTFLLEAADDITYYASDLEDALKRKLVSLDGIVMEIENFLHVVSDYILKTRSEFIAKKKKKLLSESEFIICCSEKCKNNSEKRIVAKVLSSTAKLNDAEWVESLNKCKIKLEDIKGWIEDNKPSMLQGPVNNNIEEIVRNEIAYKALRTYIKEIMIEETNHAFCEQYDKIMSCIVGENFKGELLDISEAAWIKHLISGILNDYVYHSNELVQNQIKAAKVLDTLLRAFVKAALKLGFDEQSLENNRPEDITDINVFLLFSDNYRLVCQRKNKEIDELEKKGQINHDEAKQKKVYNCLLLAMDVFAGMTDSFAMDIYHLLTASK